MKQKLELCKLEQLEIKKPVHKIVHDLDLVIIRDENRVSVLYGRCLHRGALMADGIIKGKNIICSLHNWDYRYDSGVSEYNNKEVLYKFTPVVENETVYIDMAEVESFLKQYPQPFQREMYLGQYADTHPEAAEPHTGYIQELARNGLKNYGHHGPSASMGVERYLLPQWNQLQFLPAQLARRPLADNAAVDSSVVIGPAAQKPLVLKMPVFVSDMSFGALSREAKVALAAGAEAAGTGICSGEGGMLEEEQKNNSRYLYELASGKFGFSFDKLKKVQSFHFKAGQGAKTGTGGHLPGNKVTEEIASVRGLTPGQTAISPPAFEDLKTPDDFKAFAAKVRELTGGIPVGFKMAASHIEADIDFALEAGADYIILDGRGGGTGSAPLILRDNINVPTIPALARARRHLDKRRARNVSLVITGGLRVAEDFVKALMLGADAIAISNSAMQAVGCIAMRACDSGNCPVGVATQKSHLRKRLITDRSAAQLTNFLTASNELMKVVARACGYDRFTDFNFHDLSTIDYQMHQLTGVQYASV